MEKPIINADPAAEAKPKTEAKPMTKDRLEKYISLRTEVDNQLDRLARMRSDEQFPTAKLGDEGRKVGGASDRMARAIIRRMEYEERILPQIEEAQAEMEAIEDAIDSLHDPLERDVLRTRYIDGNYHRHTKWREVARIVLGDDDENRIRMAFRIHEQALKNIVEIKK
jgi:hypothetical protein